MIYKVESMQMINVVTLLAVGHTVHQEELEGHLTPAGSAATAQPQKNLTYPPVMELHSQLEINEVSVNTKVWRWASVIKMSTSTSFTSTDFG